jgi:kynurenine formamidase
VIDLSQPLSRESQLHPFFASTQILRHIVHADAAEGRPSFNAEVIVTSNHAATHVDAFGHYDKTGETISDMPLETFCGTAICVDIRQYQRGYDVSAEEVERAVRATSCSSAPTTTTRLPARPPSSTASAGSPPRRCTGWRTGR